MKKLIFTLTIIATITSCDLKTNKSKNMEEQKNQSDKKFSQQDTTPKVTGIGGIFFFSDNPEKTKEWYSENLGLEVNQWGSSF